MFTNVAAEASQAACQWQKVMIDSWSQWTRQTITSDSFAAASSACMDWSLATQKMLTELSGQMMDSMDVPRRADLARLASQVNSVEQRLLDHEERTDEIRDLLLSLHEKMGYFSQSNPSSSEPIASVDHEKETRSRRKSKSNPE